MDHPLEPFPHLVRGLVRKSDRENIDGRHGAFPDKVRNPAGDHAGLAASGAGQDQKRAVAVENCFTLRRI
jgi:hypothetical protein